MGATTLLGFLERSRWHESSVTIDAFFDRNFKP
jgi:hypothetical protein